MFNANDEGDETVNDIIGAISPYLSHRPDVRYVPLEEARSKMGAYADALAMDQMIRSPRSRELGWNPSLHSVAGNAARLLEEWRLLEVRTENLEVRSEVRSEGSSEGSSEGRSEGRSEAEYCRPSGRPWLNFSILTSQF